MIEPQLAEQLIDFFEEHRGEVFSKTELVDIFNKDKNNVLKKLRALLKHKEIEFERLSYRVARKIYGDNNLKRGLRVYFIE